MRHQIHLRMDVYRGKMKTPRIGGNLILFSMKQLQEYMAVFCGTSEYLWVFLFSFFTGRKTIIILGCVIYNFIKLFCGRTYFI